jgi:hypothetical protein
MRTGGSKLGKKLADYADYEQLATFEFGRRRVSIDEPLFVN